MAVSRDLLAGVGKDIKAEIDAVQGNEIFIRTQLDEAGIISEFEVLARGNSYSAPAVINNLAAGEMVVHNHPSGDLTPSAPDIRLAAKLAERDIGFAIINNQAEQIYVVVEAGPGRVNKKLNKKEILNYFKKEGNLDQELENFSERKEQLITAEKIIDSFNQHQIDFIEAGTGTGKSFAYLIPALFYNNLNNAKIVVSTNTINLQEQLVNKDLLILKRVLDFDFKAVLVKGRNNYLCLRKYKNFKQKYQQQETEITIELFEELNDWKENTKTGEKSEIDFQIKAAVWNEIAAESDLCLKTACPFYNKCYFMQARKEVYRADILIVNHHLLLSDARVKVETGSAGRGILPNFNHLIIDEAHNIGEIATAHLGYPLYQSLLDRWLKRLSGEKNSLLSQIREDISFTIGCDQARMREILDKRLIPTAQKIRDLIPQYFKELQDLIGEFKDKKITVNEKVKNNAVWQEFFQTAIDLAAYLKNELTYLQIIYENLYLELAESNDENELKLKSTIGRCQDLIKRVEFNLAAEDENYVFWLESSYYRGNTQVVQKSVPIDVGKFLPDLIWSRLSNIIFTSATITTAGSFNYFYQQTGIKQAAELKVESPFDYAKQAQLLIPLDFPEPNKKEFLPELVSSLAALLKKTTGSTMVLFTSYYMLNYCYNNLQANLEDQGIRLLAQSKLSRNYILQQFQTESNTVIFGTSSFWEGVDLPGDLLKYLVMVKLPFPVPGEPLYKAKEKLLEKQGLNPFFNLALPDAVIRFRQGFGRLIRSKKDKGLIILYDRRLKDRKYGKMFLQSLPDSCPVIETTQQKIIEKIE
ncbi:helicase C-terminal domain-containing protein [Halanaerobium salsuginis]|uniref:ATP-dependent DNA helicase DinG n=1 Tax=Halanaerobium salsuginis TaxID=29563 RepID=A0A1I4F7Q8_9FIRM|nr:helicase C-terminal domain-containing protein [Halanaerobium salsuginis]SFL14025.1 ATP-dependent DNA helicase DinG [Halanaerobium salsuginis]